MARNRMIKKEVLEDSKIGKLSDTAKWLFIGLWIIADDEGFLQSDTDWIRIKCFPYNPQIDIKKVIKELFDLHLINENNGIIKILNFLKHQTINRPATSDLCTIYRRNSVNIQGTINEDSHLNINEVKEKLKGIEVNKKENIKESKEIVAKKPATLLPQQEVYNIFAEKYLAMSKQVYKSDKKDFIMLTDLIKKTSKEQVIQKIDIFERACKISAVSEKPIFWFTKDGFSCFTIGNFIKNYNSITPFLTDKEKEEQKRKILDEQRRQRVEEHLKKQGAM